MYPMQRIRDDRIRAVLITGGNNIEVTLARGLSKSFFLSVSKKNNL